MIQTLDATIAELVRTLTAYIGYRIGVQRAGAPSDAMIDQGMELEKIVWEGIDRYGNRDERTDLLHYGRNPRRHHANLIRVLLAIAAREPAFGQRLEGLLQSDPD